MFCFASSRPAPEIARVDGDRAAAALPRRGDDRAPRALQHAHGRVVDVGEGDMHHAAGVHERRRLARPFGRFPALIARDEESVRDARLLRLERLHPHDLQETRRADEPLQTGPLVDAQHARDGAHQRHAAEERPDRQRAHHAPEKRSTRRRRGLNLGARGFEDLAVHDAGGTDRFAGAAVETLGHLMDEPGTREIQLAFADRFDERDPAARTRRFDERLDVRRARRQTEAAPDALVVDVGRRHVATRKPRDRTIDTQRFS